MLQMTPAVTEVLRAIARECGGLLEHLVTRESTLYQVSVVSTDPGAPMQTRHSDTTYSDPDRIVSTDGGVYTMLLALADVPLSQGPTVLWPGTHTHHFHCALTGPERTAVLDDIEPQVSVVLSVGPIRWFVCYALSREIRTECAT